MEIKSGDIVQVIRGDDDVRGMLLIVGKIVDEVEFVYSISPKSRKVFSISDLVYIGESELIIPARHRD